MADNRDYYDILGVKKTASSDEIRKAYRDLARKLHPDVNKKSDAAAKFAAVQEAYDTLSDDEKRKAYDRFGRLGGRGGFGGSGARAGAGGGGGRTYSWSSTDGAGGAGFDDSAGPDLQTIFEQMMGGRAGRGGGDGFGTGGFGGRGGSRGVGAAKGRNLEHTINISFNTAVQGGKESIRISMGSETQTVDVKIPPGIESGAKLRVKGKGQPSQSGGASGDLIITVNVGSHPYYERDGLDVFLDVPITIAEATLGTKVTVPLLSGTVDLTIPPGTSSGKRIRVKNHGIENAKGTKGDFFAVIQIVPPSNDELTPEIRDAIERFNNDLKNPRNSTPWADKVM